MPQKDAGIPRVEHCLKRRSGNQLGDGERGDWKSGQAMTKPSFADRTRRHRRHKSSRAHAAGAVALPCFLSRLTESRQHPRSPQISISSTAAPRRPLLELFPILDPCSSKIRLFASNTSGRQIRTPEVLHSLEALTAFNIGDQAQGLSGFAIFPKETVELSFLAVQINTVLSFPGVHPCGQVATTADPVLADLELPGLRFSSGSRLLSSFSTNPSSSLPGRPGRLAHHSPGQLIASKFTAATSPQSPIFKGTRRSPICSLAAAVSSSPSPRFSLLFCLRVPGGSLSAAKTDGYERPAAHLDQGLVYIIREVASHIS
eukprot:4330075-Pleurochrysis_carterae.AAC.2